MRVIACMHARMGHLVSLELRVAVRCNCAACAEPALELADESPRIRDI